MYPLEQQPKYKDIVVIDGIVFTSPCKRDSPSEHKEMFPHYRVTYAIGLTCPVKLNNIEKILYARDTMLPRRNSQQQDQCQSDIGEVTRNIIKKKIKL